jgi:hypothetical protein
VKKEMERKIGFIPGTGKQSKAIAHRLAKAGFTMTIGSREKEKAEKIAAEINEKLGWEALKGETNEKVAEQCNFIFLVLPFECIESMMKQLKEHFQPGTILVDVTVPLIFQDGYACCSEDLPTKSLSEMIQELAPKEVSVIGAFKTISAKTLANIDEPLKTDIFLTADDEKAKEEVRIIIEKIDGVRVLNAGPLLFSRTTEQMTALVINLNRLNKLKHTSFKLVTNIRNTKSK